MDDQFVVFSAQIKYSVMHPGTHVWPHTGPTNCRLRMHLGLVIPKEGCKIRCANETKYVSRHHRLSYHLWGWVFILTTLYSVGLFLFHCNWRKLGWVILIQTRASVPFFCSLLVWRQPSILRLPFLIISPHTTHPFEEEPSRFSFQMDRLPFRVSYLIPSPTRITHCASCSATWVIHQCRESPFLKKMPSDVSVFCSGGGSVVQQKQAALFQSQLCHLILHNLGRFLNPLEPQPPYL